MKLRHFFTITAVLLTLSVSYAEGEAEPATTVKDGERREEDVHATIAKSKAERAKVEKDAPVRDLASMKKQDQANQKEFDNLMESGEDEAWFDQVDKLVEE